MTKSSHVENQCRAFHVDFPIGMSALKSLLRPFTPSRCSASTNVPPGTWKQVHVVSQSTPRPNSVTWSGKSSASSSTNCGLAASAWRKALHSSPSVPPPVHWGLSTKPRIPRLIPVEWCTPWAVVWQEEVQASSRGLMEQNRKDHFLNWRKQECRNLWSALQLQAMLPLQNLSLVLHLRACLPTGSTRDG